MHEGAPGSQFATRRQVALDRIQSLIARCEERAARAWRNYHILQGLTIGLAAITPCLIAIARDNPRNSFLEWLSLFFPAVAAIAAGITHVFRFREDAVRYACLAESIRSQLWRYQTRAGELGIALTEDQALDRLVVNVDELNLKSVSQWSATLLAESAPPEKPKPATA